MSTKTEVKQPKKKRRVDDIEEPIPDLQLQSTSSNPLPGPSTSRDLMPLVAPHLVKRSSKDPNRGMYPHTAHKSNEIEASGFVKASELVKCSGDQPCVYGARRAKATDAACFKMKCDPIEDEFVKVRKRILAKYRNKGKFSQKKILPNGSSGSKITKYFKTSPRKLSKQKLAKTSNTCSKTVTSRFKSRKEEIAHCVDNYHDYELFRKAIDKYCDITESEMEDNGEDKDFINKLPLHIIETVFSQLPLLDLMSSRVVCSKWKEIIDNEQFMVWKKLYFKYKKESAGNDTEVRSEINSILVSLGYRAVDDAIDTIVKCMGTKFNRRPCSEMHEILMKHPKGQLADQVMTERFAEWNDKDSRVWCQFAIAILLCETVWEVYSIYQSLFSNNRACFRPDVTDAMYCIALLLLYYRNIDGINFGLHYRVYYALYLIENHIPNQQKEKVKIVKGLPGQQSIHSYRNPAENPYALLTYEQIRVLNHKFKINDKIRIIALAGTGKTTTLMNLARLHPQLKFLNLVFNKSVSDEAQKKFPSNVTCRTAHSLAYESCGRYLNHKLVSRFRTYDLRNGIKHNILNMHLYTYLHLVLSTINNFTTSVAPEISLNLVPLKSTNGSKISPVNRQNILKDACQIWERMIDRDDTTVKITHDVYLKLFQLRKPKFHKYQCIMVDEAQDCNPAMLDIIISQTIPVILVGDPYQQIYSFRGAENALQKIEATHTYYLTQSFRFGPEVAYIASCLLEHYKKDSRHSTIVGNCHDTFINGKVEGQYAVLARTNSKLFSEAIRLVVLKNFRPNEPTVINAAFAGGIKSYGFDQLIDIYMLSAATRRGEKSTNKFLSRFKSYDELSNYAKRTDDTELLSKIEIVNQYGSDIPRYVSILLEKCSHPKELANVVFSTVHKAKGLEFDTVYLAEDFTFNCPFDNIQYSSNPEDINILYVGVTRAKRCLLLSEKLIKILLSINEKFEYPVSSKLALGDKTRLTCCQCNTDFVPHTVLVIVKHKLGLSSGREIAGGPLCVKCRSDPHMRPDVHVNRIVMYLDPTMDKSHMFMNRIAGPLPTDPQIVFDAYDHFEDADQVFVINVNIH